MTNIFRQYILYCFFAVISIILNIFIQIAMEFILSNLDFSFLEYKIFQNITYLLIIKMTVATILCFTFKFIVDKLFIFKDKTKDINKNIFKIFIYGFFAIWTTLIFWGVEFLFKILFHTLFFEITGAIIGLLIGYTIKFFLDKEFVFKN